MNERIKKIRKALDLTQQQFANKIGTTANVLTNYETGRRNPSSSVINNICKTFNVNETWLRTGEGEMFLTVSRDEEIAMFVNQILQNETDNFKRRFIAALSHLPEAGWMALETMVLEMAGEKLISKEITQTLTPEQQARAEADQYYQELLDEKKAAAESSALRNTESNSKMA